jgi:hypothetical protein
MLNRRTRAVLTANSKCSSGVSSTTMTWVPEAEREMLTWSSPALPTTHTVSVAPL